MNKGKYMLRVYNKIGNIRNDVYFHNLYRLLQEYVKNRISLIDSKNPTFWIHNGEDYLRVHSFQFKELNPDTYRRYLKERIIDTDYLLEDEMKQSMKGILIDIINIKFEPYPVYVYMNNGFYYTESCISEYRKLCTCDQDYREELSYAYY